MNMESAIKKAIEGGYDNLERDIILAEWNSDEGGGQVHSHFLLDPLFWQALGKSLGWGSSCWHHHYKLGWEQYRHAAKCVVGHYAWEAKWHRFIDKIASGGTAEEFFKDLLAKETK